MSKEHTSHLVEDTRGLFTVSGIADARTLSLGTETETDSE